MKKILGWGLVVLIVATLINDAGRYLTGSQQAAEIARSIAPIGAQAAREYRGTKRGRDKAWAAIYPAAQELGGTAENVDVNGDAITVWVRYDVEGTWVIAPVQQAMLGTEDWTSWWESPVPVTGKARSLF